jgi:hypothetical protein
MRPRESRQRDVLNFRVNHALLTNKGTQEVILIGDPSDSRTYYSDKAVGHDVYRRFLDAGPCLLLGCSLKQALDTRFRGVETGFS